MMIWLYEWELLVACHFPEKFGDHKYCDCEDSVVLICCVTSTEDVFKKLMWLYGWKTLTVSDHLIMIGGFGLLQVEI